LFEGLTPCYPDQRLDPDFKLISQSSSGKPLIFALEGTDARGRIIVDCAFTKLTPAHISKSWRYIRNSTAWIMWIENLLGYPNIIL
jgi:hypothetical protein